MEMSEGEHIALFNKHLQIFLRNRFLGHPVDLEIIDVIQNTASNLPFVLTLLYFEKTMTKALPKYNSNVIFIDKMLMKELITTTLCLYHLNLFPPEIIGMIGRLIVAPLVTKQNKEARCVMAINDAITILSFLDFGFAFKRGGEFIDLELVFTT